MKKLIDLIDNDKYYPLLNSLLPGGENWCEFIKNKGDCLTTCPCYKNCQGYGPDDYI